MASYADFWGEVGDVEWSPDGRTLAIGSWDATLHIYDVLTDQGSKIYEYDRNPGFVHAISGSYDGHYLACAGDDLTVFEKMGNRWSVRQYYRGQVGLLFTVKWSPTDYRLAARWNGTVRVWDALTGEQLQSYGGHSEEIHGLTWSPDGRWIASADGEKTVQIWDVRTGAHHFTYPGYEFAYGGYETFQNAVAWSSDGSRIASMGKLATIEIWQATE